MKFGANLFPCPKLEIYNWSKSRAMTPCKISRVTLFYTILPPFHIFCESSINYNICSDMFPWNVGYLPDIYAICLICGLLTCVVGYLFTLLFWGLFYFSFLVCIGWDPTLSTTPSWVSPLFLQSTGGCACGLSVSLLLQLVLTDPW